MNVWNYVLPVQTMKALAYGGTSVEGNLFRWSDIVANYNPDGYFVASPFHLYMPGNTLLCYVMLCYKLDKNGRNL